MSARSLLMGAACAVAALFAAASGAQAQTYPEKAITIVVPSSAGGPADVAIRLVNDRLSAALGQSLVVETVAGAVEPSAWPASPGRRRTAIRC